MKKFLAAVGVLVLGASLAFAHEGGKHRGHRGKMGFWSERLSQELGLTDAQREQIRTIQTNFRTANEPFFTATRELREQFREAKRAGDTARLEALKGQLEAQKAQMKQLHEGLRSQILSVLTPEQRAKFEALKAEREARRGRGRNSD